MAIIRVLGVLVVVLLVTSLSQGQSWQSQPPASQQGIAPLQQGAISADQPYTTTPPGYGGVPRPPTTYQGQQIPPDSGNVRDGQIPYQYPPYHNPYYNGASAGEFLSGTVDWFFSLPSSLIDRVTNFMDSNFFPQSPATSGGLPRSEVQGPPPAPENKHIEQSLPPAAVYQPDSR